MSVQTVLGNISPSSLGRSLTHEHFSLDYTHFYTEPPAQLQDKFQGGFTLQNVGTLRQYPYSSKYNLQMYDLDGQKAVLNDVKAYKKYGGGTIVENTTVGLKRNVQLMKDVSKATGVHVVAGTGYYLAEMQTDSCLKTPQEQMYDFMLKELTEGCVEDPNVKAGFLGEIASIWPIQDFEKRAIKASGEVQESTGCGVSFHPHRLVESPFEIIRLYLEAGGHIDKAVMSHVDRTIRDKEKLLDFAALGCYCQWDLFGNEISYYQLALDASMPSDSERLHQIDLVLKERGSEKVLMSHDIHTKHRLMDFGGHGYSHILNSVLPRMLRMGITQEQIDQITITNPAKWLTIKA